MENDIIMLVSANKIPLMGGAFMLIVFLIDLFGLNDGSRKRPSEHELRIKERRRRERQEHIETSSQRAARMRRHGRHPAIAWKKM